jgi:hypothetical protein
MDERLRQLLDQIPERPPRSKLEPHADIIRELRRKRRTYQEIATFFREHLQLSVAPSTLHDFVKTRARQARHRSLDKTELAAESTAPAQSGPLPSPAPTPFPARQTTVNVSPATASLERPRFEFDPEQPLTLNPKTKE